MDARNPTIARLATIGLLALGLLPPLATSRATAVLKDVSLNRFDTERMERGYYEALLDSGRRLDQLPAEAGEHSAGSQEGQPGADSPFNFGPLTLVVDDLREFVLKPDLSVPIDHGQWTTNSLGLRDHAYAMEKPPGTYRIALLGDSIASGWGVDDRDGFEPLVEEALNQRSRAVGGPEFEIWNFSVPGHAPGQRWEHFARLGWPSQPDLVLYEATPADPGWDERRLRGLLPRGIGWDAPQYRDVLADAGLRGGGDFDHYKRALRPYRWALLEEVYRTIVASCHDHGVPAVWVLVPRVGKAFELAERTRLVALAESAGFDAILDLTDAYGDRDPASLAIAPQDYHPNAEGHALLARRLEADLAARSDLIPIRPRQTAEEESR